MLQNWNNRTFERCCWMLVGSQVLPVLTSTQYGDFFLSVFLNISTIDILDSLFVGGVGGGAAWGTVTHPAEPLACTCDGSHLQPPQVSPAQLCSISFKWPSLREEVTFWGFPPSTSTHLKWMVYSAGGLISFEIHTCFLPILQTRRWRIREVEFLAWIIQPVKG